jgi:ribonuclease HI
MVISSYNQPLSFIRKSLKSTLDKQTAVQDRKIRVQTFDLSSVMKKYGYDDSTTSKDDDDDIMIMRIEEEERKQGNQICDDENKQEKRTGKNEETELTSKPIVNQLKEH